MRKELSDHTDEFSAVLLCWMLSPMVAGNGIMFLVNAQVRSRIPQVETGNLGQV